MVCGYKTRYIDKSWTMLTRSGPDIQKTSADKSLKHGSENPNRVLLSLSVHTLSVAHGAQKVEIDLLALAHSVRQYASLLGRHYRWLAIQILRPCTNSTHAYDEQKKKKQIKGSIRRSSDDSVSLATS